MLPDNVLLEIFDFYCKIEFLLEWEYQWHLLVHICRRWRQIVFASPHRLDLQIVCKRGTPVRKDLGIWPAFPVVIDYRYYDRDFAIPSSDEDNIIAALEHPDRVCYLELYVTNFQLEKMVTAMQVHFPLLTSLCIWGNGITQILPSGFLGGSAPSLQTIFLIGVPFPTLPTLLSASDLVTLEIRHIPSTGYIAPEAMVMGLAALPRLESFPMGFQSVSSRPDRIRPPPSATRTVLPALIRFEFQGASEYLEALVAQIDGPQLGQIDIHYFNQLAGFQAAQLSQFIDRSAGSETTLIKHAHVIFYSDLVSLTMSPHANYPSSHRCQVIIRCEGTDWQVSHMAQVLSQISVARSSVVHLQLEQNLNLNSEETVTDDVEWLHLLHQFPTLRTLKVDRELARHVAPALEGTMETAAEVLPSLELIWIGGRRVDNFDTARRLSGRPVIVCTKKAFDARFKFYVGK